MSDVYKTTSTTSYGGRIKKSLVGVLIGIALFIGSFFVLFWNEGRVDMSKIADDAVQVESSVVSQNPDLQGGLVYTRGDVTSTEQLGDGMFLKRGDYLAVERVSEMYSWVEEESTTSKKNLGGSETKETTYEYEKEWMEKVPDSSDFYQSSSYHNPVKEIDSQTLTVSKASIDEYELSPKQVIFPEAVKISLSDTSVDLPDDMVLVGNDYLYRGSNYSGPEVGDIRISYRVVDAGDQMTLFGSLNGKNITSYTDEVGNTLYRLFNEDFDGAIALMHSEYSTSLWLWRLVGFLMMWFGMLFVLRPISVFLDVVPIFGSISMFGFFVLTLPVALVLSLLTIILSMLIHNIVIVIMAGIIALVVAFFVLMRRNKKTAAPAA
jgi:hypothetical protein